MTHVVCYSGGHSSALAAIEVYRREGRDHLTLLNHDIHASVESPDIKRFKQEIADYIGVPVTYANMDTWATRDQFDVAMDEQAFALGTGVTTCTSRMKTRPFRDYLEREFPGGTGCVIYYGFDATEQARIQRRTQILGADGYTVVCPLAQWPRTIHSTTEIGIAPPYQYAQFKHANCIGCLKAGKQHWYVVYCTRPDIWGKALAAEDDIGHSIIKGVYLSELEPQFRAMKAANVPASEHIKQAAFWKLAKQATQLAEDATDLPCQCSI